MTEAVAPSSKAWRSTLLRQGPLAVFASSMPGAVNYAIILLLTYVSSSADVGTYRLMYSYFALAGLLAVCDSNKVYIKTIVAGDLAGSTDVFMNQCAFAIAIAGLASLAAIADASFGIGLVDDAIPWVALIAAVATPTQAYMSYFQARGRFVALALTEGLKYGAALLSFAAATSSGLDIVTAMYWQLGTMAAFNLALFCSTAHHFIDFRSLINSPFSLLGGNSAAGTARALSLGTVLPGALEHLDKVMLSISHGLAAVGVYTLGFSTGRFIYNAMKPALYVFYRGFVEAIPSAKTLWRIFFAFSVFGVILSLAFAMALNIPGLDKFRDTQVVTYILFSSYGVAMVDAVFTHAYAINKNKNPKHVLIGNTLSGLLCLPLFAFAMQLPTALAMIAFALHYPLRHAAAVGLINSLDKRPRKSTPAD